MITNKKRQLNIKTSQRELLYKILFLIILGSFSQSTVNAQVDKSEIWWPHEIWGAADQAGASNWITPQKVLESISLVKTGKIYELGFEHENGMPILGQRKYDLSIPLTGGPFPQTNMLAHEETLTATIGHVGTQFDALGHIGKAINIDGKEKKVFYNGFELDEVYSPEGLKKLGIEHVKPIISKGILIDIAGFRNVPTIEDNYIVTLEEVKGALVAQNIDESAIKAGDVILFNFGWWKLIDDKERYASFSLPGIDQAVIDWIIEKKVVMTGSDTYLDPPNKWGVHFDLLMKNGIYNLEFMTFESLLEDNVYEFLFIVTPLRLKGASGSPVRPIAIK